MNCIEVSKEYDVVVVGAGVGGITAAVAAAREGAKVLLVEEDLVPGGALTDYYVAMLCGKPTQGILQEILDICIKKYRLQNGLSWFPPAAWNAAIEEIIEAEPNLEVMYGAKLVDVAAANGSIRSITVNCESLMRVIRGRYFVEATGTGLFGELAGCEIMYGRDSRSDFGEEYAPIERDEKIQEVTWMYISQKLPGYSHFDMSKLEHAKLGVLQQNGPWFHAAPEQAVAAGDGIYLHWGCRVRCDDTRDSVAVADAQRRALKAMETDHATLREAGYIIYLAPKLGLREIRRIKGQYVMRCGDLIENIFPDDTVAVGKYALDLWGEDNVASHKPWNGYGIPYRSLVPLRVDNLLLSGRVISGSHIAMSSYRVMPIIGNIGQASGVAAALCAAAGVAPAELEARKVREVLIGERQAQKLVP